MFVLIIFNLLAVLTFLFLFWCKLREDYTSSQIFTTAIYVLVGIGLGVLLSLSISRNWSFWFSLVGICLGFGLGVWRYKFRFYETLDALIFSLLPWLGMIFLSDSIVNFKLASLIASIITFATIGLYYYLDTHYKNFTWYRSGKVGFAGLATGGVFFLLRAALAVPFAFVISFSGKFEALISAIVAFIFFLLVFNLSRQI